MTNERIAALHNMSARLREEVVISAMRRNLDLPEKGVKQRWRQALSVLFDKPSQGRSSTASGPAVSFEQLIQRRLTRSPLGRLIRRNEGSHPTPVAATPRDVQRRDEQKHRDGP